jgi:hypothetical protein
MQGLGYALIGAGAVELLSPGFNGVLTTIQSQIVAAVFIVGGLILIVVARRKA